MKITINDIEIQKYLAGFHLRKPDYNFKAISGEFFNKIRDILNKDFDVIPLDDNVIILKELKETTFAFNYERDRIIYQDADITYEKFEANAFQILEQWQKLNKNANYLRLAGLICGMKLKVDKPKGVYNSRIYDNYLKEMGIKEKKRQADFHINYLVEKNNRDYNININFIETLEKKYKYTAQLDVNEIDEDGTKKIDIKRAQEVFIFANNYLRQDFLNFIKIDVNE